VPRLDTQARQILAELELTSTTPARTFLPVVTSSAPDSMPPTGTESPADHWRERFIAATDDAELVVLVEQAAKELRHLRKRTFPAGAWRDRDDLLERVLGAEGVAPEAIALALRCTPTMVRRLRLTHGCEPEHGRHVTLAALDPADLVRAGLSLRAVATVLDVPRSTLSDRLSRAALQP
jgi:hypothetical protein